MDIAQDDVPEPKQLSQAWTILQNLVTSQSLQHLWDMPMLQRTPQHCIELARRPEEAIRRGFNGSKKSVEVGKIRQYFDPKMDGVDHK